MTPPHARSPRRFPLAPALGDGFTIVEVLLVICVLTVALALLLPFLGRQRHQARILVCENNLHAIAEAFTAYLDDSNQTYPASSPDRPETPPTYYDLLGKTGLSPRAPTPSAHRPLNPYLPRDPRYLLAHCPTDAGDLHDRRPAFDLYGSSYLYFDRSPRQIADRVRRVELGVWVIEGHRLPEIPRPDRKMVLADIKIYHNRTPANPPDRWHNDADPLRVSMLFADGAVRQQARKVNTGDADLRMRHDGDGRGDLDEVLLHNMEHDDYY